MLKSWMLIDNHDIPRIATQIPKVSWHRLVQALQFTLPGAPNIYYGIELTICNVRYNRLGVLRSGNKEDTAG